MIGEPLATDSCFVQFQTLRHRPHRAVKDQDLCSQPLVEQFGERVVFGNRHIEFLLFQPLKAAPDGAAFATLICAGWANESVQFPGKFYDLNRPVLPTKLR